MNVFTADGWRLFDADHYVTVFDRSKFFFRAEDRALAYFSGDEDFSDETLLAVFESEASFTCSFSQRKFVRVQSAGRVWFRPSAVNQTVHRLRDDVFTTLDRPAALAPEVAAMMRLMKRNEIERERMLDGMRQIQRDMHEASERMGVAQRTDSGRQKPSERVSEKPEKARTKPVRGETDTGEPAVAESEE